VRRGRMLPRPATLGDGPPLVLFCVACALATAPRSSAGERFDALRADPPAGMEPSIYQREGAVFLAERWAALLSDDKGLGKTAQALIAIPDNVPVIVVCPASVKPGWEDEVLVWRDELHARAISGRKTFIDSGGPLPGEVYILNYDILPARIIRCRCNHGKDRHPSGELIEMVERGEAPAEHVANTCLDCKCRRYVYSPPTRLELIDYLGIKPGTILIADEVHHTKRSSSEKTKRFRELSRAVDRTWGLSASPLENTEAELRATYQSIGIFDGSFGTDRIFRDLFKSSREKKEAPSGEARDEIRLRRSRVELGRTAEQVGLQLPPLRFAERRVVLTPAALAEVEALMVEAMATKRAWDQVKAGKLADPGESPGDLVRFEREREMLKAVAYADQDIIEAIKEVIALGPRAKVGAEMSKLRKALAIAKLPSVVGSFVEGSPHPRRDCQRSRRLGRNQRPAIAGATEANPLGLEGRRPCRPGGDDPSGRRGTQPAPRRREGRDARRVRRSGLDTREEQPSGEANPPARPALGLPCYSLRRRPRDRPARCRHH